MTKTIARQYGRDGVTAYAVAPGFVDTPFNDALVEQYGLDFFADDTGLGEVAGPQDLANVIVFLASGLARHATGSDRRRQRRELCPLSWRSGCSSAARGATGAPAGSTIDRPGDGASRPAASRSPAGDDVDDAVAAAQARVRRAGRRCPPTSAGRCSSAPRRCWPSAAQAVASTLGREGGKTAAEARGELGRAVETLAWNGEEAGRIEGRVIAGQAPGSQRLSVPAPLGVVAAFTAWNFPAVLATRKLGAILAAGCTAVLKAAEATPAHGRRGRPRARRRRRAAGRRQPRLRRPRRGLRAADRRARGPRGHVHRLDRGRAHRRRPRRRGPQARGARARRARARDRRRRRRRRARGRGHAAGEVRLGRPVVRRARAATSSTSEPRRRVHRPLHRRGALRPARRRAGDRRRPRRRAGAHDRRRGRARRAAAVRRRARRAARATSSRRPCSPTCRRMRRSCARSRSARSP